MADEKLCPQCDEPIERVPGTRGRLPKVHEECRADYEAAQSDKEREDRVAEFATDPPWVTALRDLIRVDT